MKLLIALSVMAVSMAATSTALAASERATIRSSTDSFIASTWHRQEVMGEPKTPTTRSYMRMTSIRYLRWVEEHWKRINWRVLQRFRNPPHLREFTCIHGYEGAWQAATGNGYYGGLQMELGFQRSYGGYLLRTKGTANHWTPLEQIWAAEKAHRNRGFWPWPNTARYCHLL